MKKNRLLECVKIATSIFRFYYYVIRNNKKKYDIATNQKESVMIMFSPVILILMYPFVAGAFISTDLAMVTTFLLIPLFILNFSYLNHTSDEKYRIEKEKIDAEHKKKMEEVRIAKEKKERREEAEHRGRKEKEFNEYFERISREYAKKLHEEITRKAQPKVDRNKMNAIKLMGLSSNPTIEEVKKSYRKLSKIHHPDTGGSQENFIRLTKAYDYLMKIL